MVQLLVAGSGSRTLAVECGLDCSVRALKHLLAAKSVHAGPPDAQVLLHGGCVLADALPLSHYAHLGAGSTVHLTSRLPGGGGDGGATGAESRSCYLEMYLERKPDKVNPAEELLAKWTQCHLSGQTLLPPCVVDELGNLFNKDALVQALLSKSLPPALAYISGLKNVVELKLEPNLHKASSAPKAAERGSHQPANNETEFCCPVTGVQFNGRFRFLAHRRTGHAVSDKALKEVPSVVEELVGGPWGSEDWITINPVGEHLEELRLSLAAKLQAERAERERRARKKAAKAAAAAAPSDAPDEEGAGPSGRAPAGAAGALEGGAGASSSSAAAAGSSGSGGEGGGGRGGGPGRKRSPPSIGGAPAAAAAAGPAGAAGLGGGAGARLSGIGAGAAAAAARQQAQQAGAQQQGGGAQLAPAAAKKAKTEAPVHATPSLYASLFTSSLPQAPKGEWKGSKDFCCRATSARGVNLS